MTPVARSDGPMRQHGFDEVLAALDPSAAATANLDVVVTELGRVLDMVAVGVSVLNDDMSRGPLSWSNPIAAQLEDHQFTSGEGPCLEAFSHRAVVLEPNLATAGRWPMFTPGALDLGVQAVFAFPLGIGGQLIGALDLCRSTPGSLAEDELTGCVLVGEVVTQLAAAIAGAVPAGALPRTLDEVAQERAEVHQAAGITAVQLHLGVSQAMALMRARAWSDERPLRELAHAIVRHDLRLVP